MHTIINIIEVASPRGALLRVLRKLLFCFNVCVEKYETTPARSVFSKKKNHAAARQQKINTLRSSSQFDRVTKEGCTDTHSDLTPNNGSWAYHSRIDHGTIIMSYSTIGLKL